MDSGEALQQTFVAIAQRWRDFAERRRADFTELYESGRWPRYYSEERLLERMREVVQSAERWTQITAGLAAKAPPPEVLQPRVPDPTSRAA
jgi:uncharacterized repeat protein (TIGR03809 family)